MSERQTATNIPYQWLTMSSLWEAPVWYGGSVDHSDDIDGSTDSFRTGRAQVLAWGCDGVSFLLELRPLLPLFGAFATASILASTAQGMRCLGMCTDVITGLIRVCPESLADQPLV